VTSELDKDEKWNYYIQTFMMCAPTEGIPLERTSKVFLHRGYPQEKDLLVGKTAEGVFVRENMEVRICVNTYRLFFMPGTEDLIVKDPKTWAKVPENARRNRADKWRYTLRKIGWMMDTTDEEIAGREKEWDNFLKGKPNTATITTPTKPQPLKIPVSTDTAPPPPQLPSVSDGDASMSGV
jgi:paired amphipathic helix protein Sin3a